MLFFFAERGSFFAAATAKERHFIACIGVRWTGDKWRAAGGKISFSLWQTAESVVLSSLEEIDLIDLLPSEARKSICFRTLLNPEDETEDAVLSLKVR